MNSSGKLSEGEKISQSSSTGISVGVAGGSVAIGALGDGVAAGARLQAVIESANRTDMILAINLLLEIGFVFILHPF